mmetsp:Transcript_10089/g.16886  ORF Transcript_10089/g.16886 Transcript_10089/m.16886 type:complete len:119 (-) Transcript_10089:447-803(-)
MCVLVVESQEMMTHDVPKPRESLRMEDSLLRLNPDSLCVVLFALGAVDELVKRRGQFGSERPLISRPLDHVSVQRFTRLQSRQKESRTTVVPRFPLWRREPSFAFCGNGEFRTSGDHD